MCDAEGLDLGLNSLHVFIRDGIAAVCIEAGRDGAPARQHSCNLSPHPMR